jgi:hypothetical protein
VSSVQDVLQELAKLTPATLVAITAFAGASGAVIAAIITAIIAKFFVTPFLGARDKQDKEVEWRKHAIELTKLDLERKIKTRQPTDMRPLRPSILDFLANYRDLRELDKASPRDLYTAIEAMRITQLDPPANPSPGPETKAPERRHAPQDN